jgi:hypothetical protein
MPFGGTGIGTFVEAEREYVLCLDFPIPIPPTPLNSRLFQGLRSKKLLEPRFMAGKVEAISRKKGSGGSRSLPAQGLVNQHLAMRLARSRGGDFKE